MDNGKNAIVTPKGVRKEIVNLLCDRFDIPGDLKPEEENDFFGLRGLLEPRDLTYLSYLLEMQYGIQFGRKEYDDPRFYQISGLSEIVAELASEGSGVTS